LLELSVIYSKKRV